jgi:hypothetical protein
MVPSRIAFAIMFASTVGLAAAPSPAPPPAPNPLPPPVIQAPPPFNRQAALTALEAVVVQTCRSPRAGGPVGTGHVSVVFQNTGAISPEARPEIDAGPCTPTSPIGACIITRYAAMSVPPFAGAPVKMGHSFTIK